MHTSVGLRSSAGPYCGCARLGACDDPETAVRHHVGERAARSMGLCLSESLQGKEHHAHDSSVLRLFAYCLLPIYGIPRLMTTNALDLSDSSFGLKGVQRSGPKKQTCLMVKERGVPCTPLYCNDSDKLLSTLQHGTLQYVNRMFCITPRCNLVQHHGATVDTKRPQHPTAPCDAPMGAAFLHAVSTLCEGAVGRFPRRDPRSRLSNRETLASRWVDSRCAA